MTSELVSIAIGGYEDCHPVNQPTLQDADRAAFEKHIRTEYGPEADLRHYEPAPHRYQDDEVDLQWVTWQAAKANSRAMEDAFEQVCGLEDKCRMYAKLFRTKTGWAKSLAVHGDSVASDFNTAANVLDSLAELLAAPFRKTGV